MLIKQIVPLDVVGNLFELVRTIISAELSSRGMIESEKGIKRDYRYRKFIYDSANSQQDAVPRNAI